MVILQQQINYILKNFLNPIFIKHERKLMFISHKSNVLQTVHETEWQCRRNSKGQDKSEYWTWLASITTQDDNGNDVVTYPSEDFTIVECTDEDVQERLNQLSDYSAKGVYNITWSDSKDTFVMTTDMDGNSVKVVESVEKDEDFESETFGDVIKTNYKMSHFSGDDTAKDARLLADKWVAVRRDRDRRLAETDYLALKDNTLSAGMKTYRQSLRDVPEDNADVDEISWPVKP